MTYYYGWKPSYPDPRNVVADTTGLLVTSEVDPRDVMQAPYDQGQLGSCTANAYAGAVEYDDILDGGNFGTPSRLGIYYGERLREGTVDYDSGAVGHDAFKDGHQYGVGKESDWPYIISKFKLEPSEEYLASRANHKLLKYWHPAPGQRNFQKVLSNNQTIAFGFVVYESFESEQVAETGIMPVPDPDRERQLGGHEVLAVGYLQSYPDHVLVRNSWGTDWGLGGYFLMPWSVILDPNYASDWRTLVRPQ